MKRKAKIALVGNPNVGKSAIFNCLTGMYVTVSNYPGTTVEVTRGEARVGNFSLEVIDTPGLYSIYPVTEDECVTLNIITTERPDMILLVVDTKNLERSLPLLFQLKETKIPIIFVLNIFDEARGKGMNVNTGLLARRLEVPVVATVAVTAQGIGELLQVIEKTLGVVPAEMPVSKTVPGFSARLMEAWYARSRDICRETVIWENIKRGGLTRLDKILISPLTGLPVLVAVIYIGLYKFVGVFGAGTVVDLLEGVFERHVSPWLEMTAHEVVPWAILRGLFVGEYGVFTLGMRYAFAIILPIVAFFFFVFAIIEDSGYLPRIAFLLDRAFKRFGLSGRAIIPMVLGLGCVTMATMVTRTLATKRERFIATVLLSLIVPCSAQMGVIMGLLSERPAILVGWAVTMLIIFAAVGSLLAGFVPGARPSFVIEIPPMRIPRLKNIMVKTAARMLWYFKEVVPLFVLVSTIIWTCQISGLLGIVINLMSAPLAAMGLPEVSASVFILGFFRRDYGAAGLYDLHRAGAFTGKELFIAVVVLTLFLPCVAQFLMTVKERGWKTGVGISVFVLLFAFCIGVLLNTMLSIFRMTF